MKSEFQARESRYRPISDIALNVILQREKTTETHDALLIDISNNGIELRTAACLLFEETIAVRILAPEVDFEFGMVGQVRWIKPARCGGLNRPATTTGTSVVTFSLPFRKKRSINSLTSSVSIAAASHAARYGSQR